MQHLFKAKKLDMDSDMNSLIFAECIIRKYVP